MMDYEEIKAIWGEKSTHDYIFINKIINRLELKSNASVLDVGTGWGVMAINLALHGFDVVTGEPDEWQKNHAGHDTNAGHHQRQDWKLTAQRLEVENNIKYQPFNAEELPYPSETFDGVFLYNTLHHISDKEKVIHECARVLRSGGVICIFEMNQSGNEYFRKTHDHDHHVLDPLAFIDKTIYHPELVEGPFTTAYLLLKNE